MKTFIAYKMGHNTSRLSAKGCRNRSGALQPLVPFNRKPGDLAQQVAEETHAKMGLVG